MVKSLVLLVLAACTTAGGEPRTKNELPEVVAKVPGRTPSFTDAEYTAHRRALTTKLAKHGLSHLNIRVEDPFVVVGDGTVEQLERTSRTVRWAADKLEQDFFTKRPAKILDIYLFQTAASYEQGVEALTGEAPTTPYGFYSPTQGAMFMNIATGGGTLVHEIVHPYVEADFPAAPTWLNEGLGSLFEQSSERDGHIIGLTNWRLAGIQQAIRRRGVPALKELTAMTQKQFYDSASSYGHARYLMYYLQEHGLLRRFYAAFRAARAKDPTGYATLVDVLRVSDVPAFQRTWESYVGALTFP
jgi:hypothetical protein